MQVDPSQINQFCPQPINQEATQREEYSCDSENWVMKRNASYTARASTSLTVALDAHPALSLSKAASPTFYSGGQQVTYTYTLTNTGNVPLTPPFSIADDKVPSNWSCDPQPELQPDSSMLCHADYLIDAGLRWTIMNTATACGYYKQQQVCSNSASASVLFRQPVYYPKPDKGPHCGDGIVNQDSEQCDPPDGVSCDTNCHYIDQ